MSLFFWKKASWLVDKFLVICMVLFLLVSVDFHSITCAARNDGFNIDVNGKLLDANGKEFIIKGINNIVADYGTLGLLQYDGASWSKLGGADPDNTGNTMVYVGF